MERECVKLKQDHTVQRRTCECVAQGCGLAEKRARSINEPIEDNPLRQPDAQIPDAHVTQGGPHNYVTIMHKQTRSISFRTGVCMLSPLSGTHALYFRARLVTRRLVPLPPALSTLASSLARLGKMPPTAMPFA